MDFIFKIPSFIWYCFLSVLTQSNKFPRKGYNLSRIDNCYNIRISIRSGVDFKKGQKQMKKFAKLFSKYDRPPKYLDHGVADTTLKELNRYSLDQGQFVTIIDRIRSMDVSSKDIRFSAFNIDKKLFNKIDKFNCLDLRVDNITSTFMFKYEYNMVKTYKNLPESKEIKKVFTPADGECDYCGRDHYVTHDGRCYHCGTWLQGYSGKELADRRKLYGKFLNAAKLKSKAA